MNEDEKVEVSSDQAAAMVVTTELKEIVESLLFASDEPVTLEILRVVFDDMNRDKADGEKVDPTNEEIKSAIDLLNAEYVETRRAYKIQQLAGGYVFATDKKFASWVGKLFKEKARRKLSQTAVETLAIIAYKQPITKSEVEFIRGVNADYIMKTLLEKNLATIVGRAHSPGRPLLYGTTPDFLKHFGLNEITDLPKPREIEELLGETELEVEKRMLANQEELEFKEKLHEKLDPNSRAPHIPRKKSKLQEPHQDDDAKTVVEKITPIQPTAFTQEKVGVEIIKKDEDASLPPPIVTIAAESESVEQTGHPHVAAPANTVAEPVELSIESAGSHTVAASLENRIMPGRSEVNEEPLSDAGSIGHSDETGIHTYVAPQDNPTAETVIPSSAAWEQPEKHDSKKGWSTWKTKIQTFFRKLFG